MLNALDCVRRNLFEQLSFVDNLLTFAENCWILLFPFRLVELELLSLLRVRSFLGD